MINFSLAEKVVRDNFQFIKKVGHYCKIKEDVGIIVVRADKRALKENIEAKVNKNHQDIL